MARRAMPTMEDHAGMGTMCLFVSAILVVVQWARRRERWLDRGLVVVVAGAVECACWASTSAIASGDVREETG